nr:MAG TPA: hypothetical protein [Caudoviricetes sp.]
MHFPQILLYHKFHVLSIHFNKKITLRHLLQRRRVYTDQAEPQGVGLCCQCR